jgi:glutamine synthetase
VNGIKFVDLRFTDTRGKEQHVTVPAHTIDAGFFKDGKMFDGSSISGWKGINESDMVLMPDTTTAVLDPFTDEPTLILTCDILEPNTMQGYERDPRSLAKRAEAYLKSTGSPTPPTSVPSPSSSSSTTCAGARHAGRLLQDRLRGGLLELRARLRGRQHRPSSGVKGGYFPVPPVDSLQDLRSAMCLALEEMGVRSRCITTRWPPPASARSAPCSTPWCARPTRPRS